MRLTFLFIFITTITFGQSDPVYNTVRLKKTVGSKPEGTIGYDKDGTGEFELTDAIGTFNPRPVSPISWTNGSGTTFTTNKFDLGGTLTGHATVIGESFDVLFGTTGTGNRVRNFKALAKERVTLRTADATGTGGVSLSLSHILGDSWSIGNNSISVGSISGVADSLQFQVGKYRFFGTVASQAIIRLEEDNSNGTNTVDLRAPENIPSSYVLDFPSSAGTLGLSNQLGGQSVSSLVTSPSSSEDGYSLTWDDASNNYTLTDGPDFTGTGARPVIADASGVLSAPDDGVRTATVNVSSASILNSNTSPVILLPAPGAGKFIHVIGASYFFDYNSIAYATNTNFYLGYGPGTNKQLHTFGSSLILAPTDYLGTIIINQDEGSQVSDLADQAIVMYTQTGNPTAGDSSMKFFITYRIITY